MRYPPAWLPSRRLGEQPGRVQSNGRYPAGAPATHDVVKDKPRPGGQAPGGQVRRGPAGAARRQEGATDMGDRGTEGADVEKTGGMKSGMGTDDMGTDGMGTHDVSADDTDTDDMGTGDMKGSR